MQPQNAYFLFSAAMDPCRAQSLCLKSCLFEQSSTSIIEHLDTSTSVKLIQRHRWQLSLEEIDILSAQIHDQNLC